MDYTTNQSLKIGDLFNIHNLVLEDILNIYQRPKLEDYDNYLFLVVKAFSLMMKV